MANLYRLLIILLSTLAPSLQTQLATTPPLPILPLPSSSQLKWQQREIIFFHHFGVDTFIDSERGTGKENPVVFNPTALNTTQWIDVAVQTGVSLSILTAKHHDGFCLWPSKYTNHSVVGSRWRDGHGDVVKEFAEAAKRRGVDIGFYLSPWDRHDPRYGDDIAYNEYYLGQLQEILTKYGSVKEIWVDGHKDPDETRNMSYYFSDWFSVVEGLQGNLNIFSDAGPGVRWIGNENGVAGTTCWSTINRTSISIGSETIAPYLNIGDPRGTDWLPAECDVSIRPGWFWHISESPKTLTQLLDIYYTSVGRNCVLLLNVPPNTTGLISANDIQQLKEFKTAINTIFSKNIAESCSVEASSIRGGKNNGFEPGLVLDDDHLWTYWAPEDGATEDHWIEFKATNKRLKFNVVRIQEAIGLGQRIKGHEIYIDGKLITTGTTVGYKKLHRLEDGAVTGQRVRIRVIGSRGIPLISSVGLHFDPFWHPIGERRLMRNHDGVAER